MRELLKAVTKSKSNQRTLEGEPSDSCAGVREDSIRLKARSPACGLLSEPSGEQPILYLSVTDQSTTSGRVTL